MISRPLHRFASFAVRSVVAGALVVLSFAASERVAVARDLSKLEAAAEGGSVPEQMELASTYLRGVGTEQNLKPAAYWYERAAGEGDPAVQDEIGYLCEFGGGVAADPAHALHWYQLSAASAYARDELNLGVPFLRGIGVAPNACWPTNTFWKRPVGETGPLPITSETAIISGSA
jgi:TPR repeat protein